MFVELFTLPKLLYFSSSLKKRFEGVAISSSLNLRDRSIVFTLFSLPPLR